MMEIFSKFMNYSAKKRTIMGATYVDVTIRNPADLQAERPPGVHPADGNKISLESRQPTWNPRERSWAAQSYMARRAPSRCLA